MKFDYSRNLQRSFRNESNAIRNDSSVRLVLNHNLEGEVSVVAAKLRAQSVLGA